jgi:hypothetical protein
MGQGGFRLLLAIGAVLAALASAGTAQASSCATRLVADWRDGRIDGTYPVACYRQALASMPEDVRVYSSARDDITRALQDRLETRSAVATKPAAKPGDGGSTSPLLIVALTLVGLLAVGSLAASLR